VRSTAPISAKGDEPTMLAPVSRSDSDQSHVMPNLDHLDSPVVTVVRHAETLAIKTGAESGGFLSFANGFLPML
jgi:hypothetical protein